MYRADLPPLRPNLSKYRDTAARQNHSRLTVPKSPSRVRAIDDIPATPHGTRPGGMPAESSEADTGPRHRPGRQDDQATRQASAAPSTALSAYSMTHLGWVHGRAGSGRERPAGTPCRMADQMTDQEHPTCANPSHALSNEIRGLAR